MFESPFHAGEQHWQDTTGQREQVEAMGQRMIRDHMPEQHQDFFPLLPSVVVGVLDEQGHPWASALCGPPGFAWAPDAHTLRLGTRLPEGDPALAGWRHGSQVGLLGIQHTTRRRNRLNGTLVVGKSGLSSVLVRQSFGNCPKYIQVRHCDFDPGWQATTAAIEPAWESGVLTPQAEQVIRRSDTFFIASSSPDATSSAPRRSEGVDVSHRGGPPGFVEIARGANGHSTLSWPDFRGNQMFNTLGNIHVQPHVGLLFMDVTTGGWLWVQGLAHVTTRPERRVHVRPTAAWWRPSGPLVWRPLEG